MKRDALRAAAKKLYKEQIKGVPKNQRMPFSQFFKQFKKSKTAEEEVKQADASGEDFDFEDMVNVSKISDDDVAEPDIEVVEESE
jgi:hypothetical protein